MELQLLPQSHKCNKCGKPNDIGYVFNDRQKTVEGTRVWQVFLCIECLRPITNGTNKEGNHGSK